jgi:uncharacterized protein
MDTEAIINSLKAHERVLRDMGVAQLSLFGSVARGEAGPASDVDVAASLSESVFVGLFELGAISDQLHQAVGLPVDIVIEPVRKTRLQAQIDRDRVRVF